MKKSTYILLGVVLLIVFIIIFVNKKGGDGVEEDKQKMSFFVTSVNPGKGANLSGILGADTYCQKLAGSVGVTGKTWRAYLSVAPTANTGVVHAKDRIGAGPWYNVKGIMIAKDLAELHGKNNLNKNTALNEKGEVVWGRGDEVNMHDILTGSNADGTLYTTGGDATCKNWTSGGTGSAWVGHHDRIGIDETAPMKSWNSSHASKGCSMENLQSTGGAGLFYCFAVSE